MTEDHKPLPVHGYRPQPDINVQLVNAFKETEENMLRTLDSMKGDDDIDQRWLAIGRTHLEQAFMAINRSVFRPGRIVLAGDKESDQ